MAEQKPKFYIQTFGCQMNVHDSEIIAGILRELNYEPVGKAEDADLILFNTCCVRENAENKVYGHIGQLKPLKMRKPNLILTLCGCMAQQESVREYIREHLPYVDLVFGTHNIQELPRLLEEAKHSKETIIDVWESEGEIVERLPMAREGKNSAWVTIMYGCNNFCSYCIVPYTRGRERSRRKADILQEISSLAEEGYKEVTLLGQNVNSYGKDKPEEGDFADLLVAVHNIDGIERIRFTTSHPKDASDKLIETMARLPKICEHFHLPLQAGNNEILRAMNRSYTAEDYLRLVKKIKEAIPGIALTTDIIVGFPGETERQFRDTLEMVKKVRYDSAFTFIYSPRTGTPAAKMEDPVPLEEKKVWLSELLQVQNQISKEINETYRGKTVEVLVDGVSKTDPTKMSGRTRTNKVVNFSGSPDLAGRFVKVRIDDPKTFSLNGVLVENE